MARKLAQPRKSVLIANLTRKYHEKCLGFNSSCPQFFLARPNSARICFGAESRVFTLKEIQRSYFANSSVPASMSSLASRIVSYPTSTNSVFGRREELAMPATSWSLPNNSKSCDALGLESKQQQAEWLARVCRFPCQKDFGINSRLGLKLTCEYTCFLRFLAVASDTILRRYRVIDWPA